MRNRHIKTQKTRREIESRLKESKREKEKKSGTEGEIGIKTNNTTA